MKLRLLCILLVCLLLAPIVSSCNYINFNTEELMNPPKPAGELYDIQRALEDSVSGDIQLKYPTTGEHRSAFTMVDLNGDSVDEVVAFYLTAANTQNVSLHIGLIVNQGGKWVHSGDIPVSASDVESLSFADMNGDGKLEILVGWAMYTQVDRVVCAYSADGFKLSGRLSEPFTKFITCDMNANGRDELLIIYQNQLEKTAVAKLFELSDDGIMALGSAQMDINTISYSEPIKITDKAGKESILLDATKADGMITEVLTYDEYLRNPCIAPEDNTNLLTFRPSSIAMYDIDGDAIPEIPCQTLFLPEDTRVGAEAVYLTKWLNYSEGQFKNKLNALMNYSDGYYLNVPNNWPGNITVMRNTEQRIRTFALYDKKQGVVSSEILKIQVVAKADYEANAQNYGSILLAEREGYLYIASISAVGSKQDITEAQLRDMFILF